MPLSCHVATFILKGPYSSVLLSLVWFFCCRRFQVKLSAPLRVEGGRVEGVLQEVTVPAAADRGRRRHLAARRARQVSSLRRFGGRRSSLKAPAALPSPPPPRGSSSSSQEEQRTHAGPVQVSPGRSAPTAGLAEDGSGSSSAD